MRRLLISILVATVCMVLPGQQERAIGIKPGGVAPAAREARIALVIGNAAYGEAPLKNPVNDARAMKEVLEGCRFQVTLLENAQKRAMEEAINAFGERIRGGAVGLFYYAGHGLQVKGENFLIPVGAQLDQEEDVPYRAVNLGLLLDRMQNAKNALNILILDACRNNPFTRSWHRGGGEKGLASVNAPRGSLISYATEAGGTAADGSGDHGLYTEALLAQIQEPGQKVEEVFKKVREKVMAGSQGQQLPFESTSVVGDFYFKPLVTNVAGPTQAELEATVWEGVKDTARARDLEDFLARFPAGAHGELAQAKLANLKRASQSVVVNNLAEPWKALQKDALETKSEYAQRVASLGSLKVGTAAARVENYDVETGKLVFPVLPDAWAKPYVKAGRVVVQIDRATLRQLLAAGGSATVATTFEIQDGRPHPGGLTLATPVGSFAPGPEAPPVAGARRNDFDLWEKGVAVGQATLALVQIPGGRFQMGTNATDETWLQHSRPVHEVSIGRDFWVGKYSVTQGQWQAVMGNNPAGYKNAGADAPVEQVSWEDVQQFITRLNGMQREWTFRLPTEAEWEYACRAGTDGETYGPLDAIAWYSANSGNSTHPVGQKQPNAFGLYDMLGNVWQWCQDNWHDDYGAAPGDGSAWESGGNRVLRGGSWNNNPSFVRSAYRTTSPRTIASSASGSVWLRLRGLNDDPLRLFPSYSACRVERGKWSPDKPTNAGFLLKRFHGFDA